MTPRRTRLRWRPPMLARLVEDVPRGAGWIFEPKLDGIRALAYVEGGKVALFSRNHLPLGAAYPELVDALATAVQGDAVLDGEIVAIDPRSGLSSFQLLQRRSQLRNAALARGSGVAVKFYLFDCLFSRGTDLVRRPLIERKAVLRQVVRYGRAVVFTPYRERGGGAMLREACARASEGILAKRADSPYVSLRSGDWLKIKCVHQQEFVIGGFTPPQGARVRLGALLVGYYDDGALRYAGKVGTGYDRATLEMLHKRLAPLRRERTPFAPDGLPRGPVTWVAPRLVAEIGFSEWTSAGMLRHPRFLGLREDKAASEVNREG